MNTGKNILDEINALEPKEKAILVDCLISSLDRPDKALDEFWAVEVESRLSAYKKGELRSVSLEEVLAKYK